MKTDKPKIKILLIDDDATLRKVYEMQFESYPEYQLLLADNAQQAEEVIKKKPALILLDLIMGKKAGVPIEKMDKNHGFNLLNFLKLEEGLKDIPVIVFSNLDNEEDKRRAKAAGAEDYWVKGQLLPSEVIERIRDFLQLEEARSKIQSIR